MNRIITRIGLLSFIMSAALIAASAPGRAEAFAGGDGTLGNPYQISTWSDLNDMRSSLSSNYILINDLTPSTAGYTTYASSSANSGSGWDPVGTSTARFSGSLNGAGYTIDGFYLKRMSASNVGLFGSLSGTVSNLRMTNAYVDGYQYVGAVAGDMSVGGATVTNVSVQGSMFGRYALSSASVGGIVGYASAASGRVYVSSSTADVTISIPLFGAGGIGGSLGAGSVTNSSASTTVVYIGSGPYGYSGGVIGETSNNAIIASSSASLNLSYSGAQAVYYVGGITGIVQQSAAVYGSYATGSISIPTSNSVVGIGGIAGYFTGGRIQDSYSSVSIATKGTAGGIVGVIETSSNKFVVRSLYFGTMASTTNGGGAYGTTTGATNLTTTGSFWNSDLAPAQVGSVSGTTGTTTVALKKLLTFTTAIWPMGTGQTWGINNVSPSTNNSGYPFLLWQGLSHDYRLGLVSSPSASAEREQASLSVLLSAIDSDASISSYGFNYGSSDSFGLSVNSGTSTWSAGTSTLDITGLQCNSSYYFRPFATFAVGLTTEYWDGATSTFSTTACPVTSVVNAPGSMTAVSSQNLSASEILKIFGKVPASLSALSIPSTGISLSSGTIPTSSGLSTGISTKGGASYSFARNLSQGMSGADVRSLQQFLNEQGFAVATSGPGSKGNETQLFGPATKRALAAYQRAKGIRPAVGYFGPVTRAFVSK